VAHYAATLSPAPLDDRHRVESVVSTVGRLFKMHPELQTFRCSPLTDAMCQKEKRLLSRVAH
jgi:hypothetical protein